MKTIQLISEFSLLPVIYALCGAGISGVYAAAEPARPNILIILADDLGYTDTGCYGATKVKTPNIDRLAAEGMRFTDAHSPGAVCSPSRYSLVTGEYPFRNPHFADGVLKLNEPLGIGTDQATIASLAKSQGHRTGVFGKWHMGLGDREYQDFNVAITAGPRDVGFDECYITPGNLDGNLYVENRHVVGVDPNDPFVYVENPKRPKKRNTLKGGKRARLAFKPDITPVFTGKAVDFIDRHKNESFLLYFAPHNVHVPVKTQPEFSGKSDCGPYGDYILELDWMVGQVLAALDRNGLADKTLVLFSSDNGGFYKKPDNSKARKLGHLINGELLGQKTDLWEGGHRVPLLVRWPGVVEAGSTSGALVSLVDLMATFSEVWKAPLPERAGPDSVSFLPVLTGSAESTRDTLIYQGHKGLLALREDEWVLIPAQGSDGLTLHWATQKLMSYEELGFVNSDYTPAGKLKPGAPPGQLYNLAEDLGQRHNLYNKHPERVARMKARLEEIKSQQKVEQRM
jgi:arylsulfatase A-like enzyme